MRNNKINSVDFIHNCEGSGSPSIAVGYAFGEIWMLDLQSGKRTQLGEAGSKHGLSGSGAKVIVKQGEHTFAFVGVKKGSTQKALQVWDVSDSYNPKQLNFQSNSKQRGLGDVQLVKTENNELYYVLVCGRGIGKAHIWKFSIAHGTDMSINAHNLSYLGSVTSKSKTLSSMRFSHDGKKLLTVGFEENTAQLWTLDLKYIDAGCIENGQEHIFDIKSGQAVSVPLDTACIADVLGSNNIAEDFLQDHLNRNKEKTVEEWLDMDEQKAMEWPNKLFPPRLLDPYAYDGEVNEAGLPHGYGIKTDETNDRLLYEGLWRDGQRHGTGQLVDSKTGDICYIGGWKNGLKHGFGAEWKPGKGGEHYEGWWRNDKKEGLGILHYSKTFSKCQTGKRIKYVGFFKKGLQNGLGWWTWPKGSKQMPFRTHPNAMAYMGAITCIAQFKEGKFFDEFNFHIADEETISESEIKRLFNNVPKSKFSKHPDGRWEGGECWACMKLAEENEMVVVCNNKACSMRIHKSCLGRAANFPVWEATSAVYCNGVSISLPQEPWFCPQESCQKLGKELYKAQVLQYLTPEQRNIEDIEKENVKTNNASNEDVIQHGTKIPKRSRTINSAKKNPNVKMLIPQQKKKTSQNEAFEMKNKCKTKTSPFSEFIRENVDYDYGASQIYCYGVNGEIRMICSDSDLEDAMEDAELLRSTNQPKSDFLFNSSLGRSISHPCISESFSTKMYGLLRAMLLEGLLKEMTNTAVSSQDFLSRARSASF